MRLTNRTLRGLLIAPLLLMTVSGPAQAAGDDAAPDGADGVEVTALTAERETNPLGLGPTAPRLGWQLRAPDGARGVVQSAYQVQVASTAEKLAAGDADVWDSGRVSSAESTLVEYGGPALEPATRYHWRVQVWDGAGAGSGWSEPAWWETGLFDAEDWQGAEWVGAPAPPAWGDVTVDVELSVTRDATGVFFRAAGVGNAYMWQLANFGNRPVLRPHIRLNGNWTLLGEISIAHVIPPAEFPGPHRMTITATGSTITTHIDGQLVDTRTDSRRPTGTVGLRTNGVEAGVVHEITVTSGGETVFHTDFADGVNPFTGGALVEGGLQVSGNAEVLLSSGGSTPLLRKPFSVGKEVAGARLYATALGVYELSLNGQRVGDHELAPGWTDYNTRIQHQTYDVTDLVADGDNVLGAMLAPGWFAGNIAWFGTGVYGERPALLARLVVEYTDGSTEVVTSDGSWRTATGPLASSDIVMGERYDARLARSGWDRPGYDDADWNPAGVAETDALERVQPQVDPPVRQKQELPARSVTQPQPGVWVFDLGQNMVGNVRLRVEGDAGQTVRIRHAEVLNPNGTVYTANLRSAQATDFYTLAGTGEEEVYEPHFTFHGFRYVELTGLTEAPDLDTVTGLVMHTDSPLTSEFETSDAMLNQLHSNITWGQRGNFLSVPTDTPARDERLGWTGDINVFAETAAFNMDSLTFLTKWLTDLRDGQSAQGAYPDVAPRVCCGEGADGWADAGVTVPWTLWQRYGDTQVIEQNFEAMTRFVDYLERNSTGLLRPNSGPYGDWLNLGDPTPQTVIGTAYFAHSATLLSQMAEAIGRDDKAVHYAELAGDVRAAFAAAFVDPDGTVEGNSQTAYVLALGMDLVPEELREAAADKLVAKIAQHGGNLSTGFLGTPDLLPVLTETGHADVAYQLLLNRDYPSWGYQIDLGATTMWERWDSIRPDGSFQDAGMNSFNHYAYGAVGDWMYRTIGGIEPAEPGYRHTVFDPQPGGGLEHARVGYDSAYGEIVSAWRYEDGRLFQEVTVPPNTTADVHVPASSAGAVTEGGVPAAEADGVTFVELTDRSAVFRVGSGTYTFTADVALGHAVDTRDAAAALAGHIGQLVEDGVLDRGERHYLALRSAELTDQAAALVTAALDRDDSAVVEAANTALGTAGNMTRWIETQVRAGRLDAAVGAGIAELVTPVHDALTALLAPRPVLAGATAEPAVVEPGGRTTVSAVVRNEGATELAATVSLALPAGWTAPGPQPVEVEPGGTTTVTLEAVAPLAGTEGPVAASVSLAHGSAVVGESAVELRYAVPVPPAGAVDHVDLGDATSEQAHGLRASAQSGTNVEAGLTRRYTFRGVPNGFFEFDVDVPDGEPFALRVVETYDSAQLKDYNVLVDGAVVHSRAYQRTQSGHGTVTYQLVVDPVPGADRVSVRFQEDALAANFDPSVADVWVLPIPTA